MFRKTVAYHRFLYMRKRNASRIRIYLRIGVILAVLLLLVSYVQERAMPYLAEITDFRLKTAVCEIINGTVRGEILENLKYEDLYVVNKDENGRIVSVKADMVRMNALSAGISSKVQQELIAYGNGKITLPMGILFGNTIFAGTGPELAIKIKTYGNVEAEFVSELSGVGTNRTRHRVLLKIRTQARMLVPYPGEKTDVTVEIPVAEAIYLGKAPQVNPDR